MSASGLACMILTPPFQKCAQIFFFPSFFPCCRFQREQWKQQRRRQQTEPAVPAGRRKVSHVQLGGRVFSTAEPRPELSAFASGQHEPPRGLRLLHVRFGCSTAGAQHARTPAPTAGLLVGTSNLQSCGFGLLKRLLIIIAYFTKTPPPSSKKEEEDWYVYQIEYMYEITLYASLII